MLAGQYSAAAHAKVNLGLAILTRRGDGFHEIETQMARLQLADDVSLTIGPAEQTRIGLEVTYAKDLPAQEALPTGSDNLAWRAAAAYLEAYARAGGQALEVSIQLHKRIPSAAGLGGGSSDAATVLLLLQQAEGDRPLVSGGQVGRLGLALGSDVPFFLQEAASAVARGRGERLTPTQLPPLHLVLAKPDLSLSAADGYRALVGYTPRLRAERALQRLAEGLDPGWSNGLQPGVLRAHPQVRQLLATLRAAGLKGVLMSGSGPTCFGLAASAAAALELATELQQQQPKLWVRASGTLQASRAVGR